jgi:hypothetical protein
MKYRKKPAVVEAFQMTEERRWNNVDWPEWLHAAWNSDGGEGSLWPDPDTPPAPGRASSTVLACGTPEGVVRVRPTDWIVQGVKGELYPVRDDIFRMTYEEVQ